MAAEKTSVTVLGLGAMGRALATAFVRAGHPTTVWNRSPGRAAELVALGATEAGSAEEAVRASELVVMCLVDHHAVTAVNEQIADALAGRVLVNLTSDTPERARETAAWAVERGIDYLDGAIMVPVQVIGTPDSLVFHSGPRALFDRHADALGALGGKIEYVGEEPGRAAAYDMALLDYFYASISGMVHAFALAEAEGVAPGDIAPFLDTITGIMPLMTAGAVHEISARDYAGDAANLAMMAATVDHLVEVSEHRGLDTGLLHAVRAVAQRALAQGRGKETWTATVEAVRPPK
ncbi:NAD(P)-dependent oxidoreductase [Streptomyces sp. NPDC127068]|uniref:NAD(P)-dependent oxidoreductase n=1 Tax=Streptomyces sp. NPDC127068 TaxID=3347127 RepID=UPI003647C363